MMSEERGPGRTYRIGDIRVIWRPAACIHSGVCVRGLPAVFRPQRRPWIDVAGAPSDRIVAQVERCPSGALSWERVGPDVGASEGRPDREESDRRGPG
jgi:uncharacterized Fe-S cluster protein YjdI